jgi:hypothetical protein
MHHDSFLPGILIVLLILSGSHAFYGKNLPKYIWWLSVISSAFSGIVLGLIVGKFPDNIYFGITFAIILVGFTFLERFTRKKHDV